MPRSTDWWNAQAVFTRHFQLVCLLFNKLNLFDWKRKKDVDR